MKKGKYVAYNKLKDDGKFVGHKYVTDYSDPGESKADFIKRVKKSNERWSKKSTSTAVLVGVRDRTKKMKKNKPVNKVCF